MANSDRIEHLKRIFRQSFHTERAEEKTSVETLAQSLGLTGKESYEIIGLNGGAAKMVTVVATPESGAPIKFEARVRIDTPKEREYFQHGGILHYVLRQLAASSKAA